MTQPLTEILAALVGIPSVVGRPNAPIVAWVTDYLARHGVEAQILPGPEGDRANLFATIGPKDRPGYILSGHLDVVAAEEPTWIADPFRLRQDGGRLIGRGACDMKGFVAAVLAMVPDLVAMKLAAPIHLALSYDEEAGARGAPHMIAELPRLCATPLGVIVGEPSGLVPVLRHKGKAALRVAARGLGGHSSRPELGRNAIHRLLAPLSIAVARAEALKLGPFDPAFAPPYSTLQIGVIQGGVAVNVIPDHAFFDLEIRAISGVDPRAALEEFFALKDDDLSVELLSSYPPLSLDEAAPLVGLMSGLTGHPPQGAVSYGTEAGLFQQAGIPTVICGPGDIARAHKPEEWITQAELEAVCTMIRGLAEGLPKRSAA